MDKALSDKLSCLQTGLVSHLLIWVQLDQQILVIKATPHFDREANRKLQKLFPFVTLAEKHAGVPKHLKKRE